MTRALSLELINFTSKGQQGLSYLRAHPPPPSAGLNVTFEDLMLNNPIGAPPIFVRLAIVLTGAYFPLKLLSRLVTWSRVNLDSILARRRASRGSGR